jgi:DNA repair exonuclease SbcCD nuclease subunit
MLQHANFSTYTAMHVLWLHTLVYMAPAVQHYMPVSTHLRHASYPRNSFPSVWYAHVHTKTTQTRTGIVSISELCHANWKTKDSLIRK